MKIALINPPHQFKTDNYLPEFVHVGGIGYIESALRSHGYDVVTVNFPHDKNASLDDVTDCDAIGITAYIDCYNFFKETLPELKEKTVLVGGPLISSYGRSSSNLLMKQFPEIDVGVIGEGEIVITELIKALEFGTSLGSVNGIIYRSGGELKPTGLGRIVPFLDDLPKMDYERWAGFGKAIEGRRFSLQLARGCYNQCSFCYKLAPGIRSFSLSRSKEEIEEMAKFNPAEIVIDDEDFLFDTRRAVGVSEICAEYGLTVSVQARADGADYSTLKRLAENGFKLVRIGVESFNEEVLKRNGKNITKKQIYAAINASKKAGLRPYGFFLLGLPGETEESLEETIKGIEETGVIPRTRLVMPLPGTKLYRTALKQGLIEEVELLQQYAEHYDTTEGDFVPVNFTDLPDKALLEAREKINEIKRKNEES